MCTREVSEHKKRSKKHFPMREVIIARETAKTIFILYRDAFSAKSLRQT